MEKRKGRLDLIEALDYLDKYLPEATTAKNYPDDGTGVAGDDDQSPGNILLGSKFKEIPYFNRLTTFARNWDYDNGDWTWDHFVTATGMDDFENYSNTLNGLQDLLPDEVWANIWKRMKNVPDHITNLRFDKAGQPYRTAKDGQTGKDKEPYVDIDAKDDGAEFKDAEIKNKGITERISNFML